MTLRGAYVTGMHRLRDLAGGSGLLAALERRRDRRWSLYLRSLFAIYDVEDLMGLELPWWSFAAIDRVEALLAAFDGCASAFEYGAGASTAWLAPRCARVVSIEHDPAFTARLQDILGRRRNVTLRSVAAVPVDGDAAILSERRGWRGFDFRDYVAAIDDAGGPFDLIVIDGRARSACLEKALDHLAPRGTILFDNSNRRTYRAAIAASGLARRSYRGLCPCLPYPSETTLLSRDPERI